MLVKSIRSVCRQSSSRLVRSSKHADDPESLQLVSTLRSCSLALRVRWVSSRKVCAPISASVSNNESLTVDVATIKLAPVLPTNVAVVHFPDVRKATEAVVEIMNQGVGIRQ